MQIRRGQQHFPTCPQRQRQTHIHTTYRDTHKQSPKQKHSPHTQEQTFTDTHTQAHTQTRPDSHTHTPRDRCVWSQTGTYSIPTTYSGNTRTDTNTHAQKHMAMETDIRGRRALILRLLGDTQTHIQTPTERQEGDPGAQRRLHLRPRAESSNRF